MNGFINYYKPSGISSAYAINRIKKLFKGVKVGHMGTLDPLAEGVLPLAVGKSTRLFDYLLDKQKVYIAEFTFGYETDTLDRGGQVVKSDGRVPTEEEILKVIPSLTGNVLQIPPKFSAKNVGGKRGYELARQGVEFELKPKAVEIEKIELLSQKNGVFKFEITCKGGTYIRAIARDMAYALNTFATMTSLIRTKSGLFGLDTAICEEDLLKKDIKDLIVKPEKFLTYEKINLSITEEIELENGRPCKINAKNGLYSVFGANGTFIGVGVIENDNLKIKARIKE